MKALLQVVDQEQIYLSTKDLSLCPRIIYGLYFYDPKDQQAHIVLDKQLKEGSPLYRSVLAEELGHHFTIPQTSFLVPYTSYAFKVALSKDERRALKWACDFLIPIEKLDKALIDGLTNIDELAQHFNVTPWLMRRRFQFISQKQSYKYIRKYAGKMMSAILFPAVLLSIMTNDLASLTLSTLTF